MERVIDIAFRIRSYQTSDRSACRQLFSGGRIDGRVAENDCGSDIDQIDDTYFKAGGHFWIAELTDPQHGGRVVGMIGLQQREQGSVEVRRLRVHEDFRRRGIGAALMDEALRHCQENGHLRIILDTFHEREPAIRLFEKFHFRHGRTRRVGDKDLLYFYLDLYEQDKRTQ